MKNLLPFFLFIFLFNSCASPSQEKEKEVLPNVILIMADDMGYECLSANGSLSYQTPNIDRLAANGIRFTNCISQPLCTPSRVKIMTGKYNYRNYEYFGYLNSNQRTFGNMMKEAGYATCIVGKWQLNGLAYELESKKDNTRPYHFGFDEYCLWQLTVPRTKETERYANPTLEQNGKVLEGLEDAYGPDIVSNYALDFIERNKDNPFFVYYPMILPHNPFVPTPDSENWDQKELRYKADTSYFKDMISYVDKIVGNIVQKVEDLGLADNTIILFTADNGTNTSVISHMPSGPYPGAKGNTIDAGTHVPFVAYYPKKIKETQTYDGLISFADFFPTLAEIIEVPDTSDGHSFLPLLQNETQLAQENIFIHYDPRWGKNVNAHRNQFARTLDYKLYQDGEFYNLKQDKWEKAPLSNLTDVEQSVRQTLQEVIDGAPKWE